MTRTPVQINIQELRADIQSGMKRLQVLEKYQIKNGWLNRIIAEHKQTTGEDTKFRKFHNKPYEIVNPPVTSGYVQVVEEAGDFPMREAITTTTSGDFVVGNGSGWFGGSFATTINSEQGLRAIIEPQEQEGERVFPEPETDIARAELARRLMEAMRDRYYNTPIVESRETSSELPVDQAGTTENTHTTGQVENETIEW